MSNRCRPLWREAHVQVTSVKRLRAPRNVDTVVARKDTSKAKSARFDVEMSIQCMPLKREGHVQVKSAQNSWVRSIFARSPVILRQGQGIVHAVKSQQSVRVFDACPKTMTGVGQLKRTWKDDEKCMSPGRGSTRDMFIRDLRGQGADFFSRVAFWSI